MVIIRLKTEAGGEMNVYGTNLLIAYARQLVYQYIYIKLQSKSKKVYDFINYNPYRKVC
jgi:hypothetical protein